MSAHDTRSTLALALLRVLRALARVALRYGVSANAMGELVRRAWVEEAERLLVAEGREPLVSRVCALTGLYRKEVVRLKELPSPERSAPDDRYDRSARVVSGWCRDADFRTASGRPAVLAVDGEGGFAELVRRYSGDMTTNAMLEELLRAGTIERSRSGAVRLVARAHVPRVGELDVLQILGTDAADLIDTIHHNIGCPAELRRFQRKVSYVHIPSDHQEAFRELVADESQALLERLDRWLASRDTEPPGSDAPGSALGLGIYMIRPDHDRGRSDRSKERGGARPDPDDDEGA